MRLNQYIAHCGLCSRRKADDLIKSGKITVNDVVITSMGTVVEENDIVACEGQKLQTEKKVYVLLNKPKGYITTTADEKERKTVVDLVIPQVMKATRNPSLRIYPVGRLDRNTTGLLLLTNDGELAQALTHPSYEIAKVYFATLDRPLAAVDFAKIEEGLDLEDGFLKVDEVAYAEGFDKMKIGLALHSGKNRIVRRIFEHLGYEVMKLDRVMYASLTKKDLPRGKWRFLMDKEIIRLKYFSGKKMENIKVTKVDPRKPKFSQNAFKKPKYNGSGPKRNFNGPRENRPIERIPREQNFNTERRHISRDNPIGPPRERTFNNDRDGFNKRPRINNGDVNRPPRPDFNRPVKKDNPYYQGKMNNNQNPIEGSSKDGTKKYIFNKPPRNPFDKKNDKTED